MRAARRRAQERQGQGQGFRRGRRPAREQDHREEGRRHLACGLRGHRGDLVLHANAVLVVGAIGRQQQQRAEPGHHHRDGRQTRRCAERAIQRSLPVQMQGGSLHPRCQPGARDQGRPQEAGRRLAGSLRGDLRLPGIGHGVQQLYRQFHHQQRPQRPVLCLPQAAAGRGVCGAARAGRRRRGGADAIHRRDLARRRRQRQRLCANRHQAQQVAKPPGQRAGRQGLGRGEGAVGALCVCCEEIRRDLCLLPRQRPRGQGRNRVWHDRQPAQGRFLRLFDHRRADVLRVVGRAGRLLPLHGRHGRRPHVHARAFDPGHGGDSPFVPGPALLHTGVRAQELAL